MMFLEEIVGALPLLDWLLPHTKVSCTGGWWVWVWIPCHLTDVCIAVPVVGGCGCEVIRDSYAVHPNLRKGLGFSHEEIIPSIGAMVLLLC